jgi:N-methylhydantoinase A/oxoprolinase/acetone carboxylase beta subunit
VYFPEVGRVDVPVQPLFGLVVDGEVVGPAIIEGELTTIVVPPGATGRRSPTGGVVVETWNQREDGAPT